jgi:hypothetical protein
MPTVLRLSLAVAAVVAFALLALTAIAPDQAQAHRSWCHSRHTCPSDHATYRWYGRAAGRLGPLAVRLSHCGRTQQHIQDSRPVWRPRLLLQAMSGSRA